MRQPSENFLDGGGFFEEGAHFEYPLLFLVGLWLYLVANDFPNLRTVFFPKREFTLLLKFKLFDIDNR